ncbi:MAG: hypothetical protein M3433_03735 [Actinomycetota bacterium]|nr:hypothetical protein [Actinomycetota bacterium]MDQ3647689.1 hypothetical protein [Actinomycetota bacterium]
MLTAGIAIMVMSVVVGVIVLTYAALMYSPARDVGRRVSTAMAITDHRQDAPSYPRGHNAPSYPAEQNAPAYAAQAEDAPRWVLALAGLSAAGLVLGLLITMVASLL